MNPSNYIIATPAPKSLDIFRWVSNLTNDLGLQKSQKFQDYPLNPTPLGCKEISTSPALNLKCHRNVTITKQYLGYTDAMIQISKTTQDQRGTCSKSAVKDEPGIGSENLILNFNATLRQVTLASRKTPHPGH